ncbi:MAG TPA: Rrf2 family transcriptional regulator [Candidatus Cloacimonadota bacterium]|nr:Rrf2 family transcriptional regulator [Candidatus Cloacimonadota bacterium]HPS38108.1 Rrf2 family transcriptional regulator [Candidatus Cloacimonadota bacterium]
MAINTRTEYALRALIEMVDSGDTPLSAREICVRQELPKKYVEHLLAGLKLAGVITSCSGSKGGYTLTRPADEITLRAVMNSVEDNTFDLNCYSGRDAYCLGENCGLSSVFGNLTTKLNEVLDSFTLNDFYKHYKERHTKERS